MKTLKFIHITKTAGTSIENIAYQNGIHWGRFHNEYGLWHEPFIAKHKWLKDKYDWFTVVRNPYTRIVSEFYCEFGGPKNKDVTNEEFNKIIQNYILIRNDANKPYGQYHYIEQSKYIDKCYNIRILKYEDLPNNFNSLMREYSLDIILDYTHDNKGIQKIFDVSDLNDNSIHLINSIYSDDFMNFNYPLRNIL